MGQKPVPPFWPDRQAAAAKYHAGHNNAQLRTHKAWLLHAEIISTVMVRAKIEAARNEMREPRHPRRTPKIAGGRNRNKHSLGTTIHMKHKEGRAERAALTQTVRRETDPTR